MLCVRDRTRKVAIKGYPCLARNPPAMDMEATVVAQPATIAIDNADRAHPQSAAETQRSPASVSPPCGWHIWYGPFTRRWWAMPPATYRHAQRLLEAPDPQALATLIQQAERTAGDRDDGTGTHPRRHPISTRPRSEHAAVGHVPDGRSSCCAER